MSLCLLKSHRITLSLHKFYKYLYSNNPRVWATLSLLSQPSKYKACHTFVADTKIEKRYFQRIFRDSIPLRKLSQEMDASLLLPPPTVKGMTELNREAFQKKVMVPHVTVKTSQIHSAVKYLKKYMLKIRQIKPVQCSDDPEKKVILLNPLLVNKYEDIKDEFLLAYNDDAVFEHKEITLNYENWTHLEILKAILPENEEGPYSYSSIGHILHLNLRDHMLPYKFLIGQVYLDKHKHASLVVNKAKNIDNTYRTFQMEVLAGTGDTNVVVSERGRKYTMDFAKVYWNPRLESEHVRIHEKLKHGDFLYDIMAGVGPFAIPAAKKKCNVFANDLNPFSYDALVQNCSLNKVNERVQCFNLDGHEFIKTVLKKDLLEKWNDSCFCGEIHVTMNLPAMAVEFLPSFIGLYHNTDNLPHNPALPSVHVYMFTEDLEESKDIALSMVAEQLGYLDSKELELNKDSSDNFDKNTVNTEVKDHNEHPERDSIIQEDKTIESKSKNKLCELRKHVREIYIVRKVAPNKIMVRVSFQLPWEVFVRSPNNSEEPPSKKMKATEQQ